MIELSTHTMKRAGDIQDRLIGATQAMDAPLEDASNALSEMVEVLSYEMDKLRLSLASAPDNPGAREQQLNRFEALSALLKARIADLHTLDLNATIDTLSQALPMD